MAGLTQLRSNQVRSRIVLLFSFCSFASAAVNGLAVLLASSIFPFDLRAIVIGIATYGGLGLIALIYWFDTRPDYTTTARPLGIKILAVETGLAGLLLIIEALILLVLPILGILGVVIGGLGVVLFILARGLWDGKDWSQQIMLIVSAIGIVASLLFVPWGGAPILAVYQFWYLRRPHVTQFFFGKYHDERGRTERGRTSSGPFRDPIPKPNV